MAKAVSHIANEATVHKAVIGHLALRASTSCFWWHTPNGEKRDAITGAKLKSMGVRAGVPDIVLVIDGKAHFLELKGAKGKLSAVQTEMRALIEAAGGVWAVAKGIDAALKQLEEWGAFAPTSARRRAA